ncbi:hypothetical protein TREES_T100014176 [Tupaia chinensis]|uniref:Uncharacterized protein n=1 Tax=Tupaia chinensis TaxID=246437 RepID=L9KI56_TUPCH|nr:hypothetical protein TREES_T100014176 [Tupaia chinensis]
MFPENVSEEERMSTTRGPALAAPASLVFSLMCPPRYGLKACPRVFPLPGRPLTTRPFVSPTTPAKSLLSLTHAYRAVRVELTQCYVDLRLWRSDIFTAPLNPFAQNVTPGTALAFCSSLGFCGSVSSCLPAFVSSGLLDQLPPSPGHEHGNPRHPV